jgi:hypothetical protein
VLVIVPPVSRYQLDVGDSGQTFASILPLLATGPPAAALSELANAYTTIPAGDIAVSWCRSLTVVCERAGVDLNARARP